MNMSIYFAGINKANTEVNEITKPISPEHEFGGNIENVDLHKKGESANSHIQRTRECKEHSEAAEVDSLIQYSFHNYEDCLCGGANACFRCNPHDFI